MNILWLVIAVVIIGGGVAIIHFIQRGKVLREQVRKLRRKHDEVNSFLNLFSKGLQDIEDIDSAMHTTARYVADLIDAESVCIYDVINGSLVASGVCGRYPLGEHAGNYVLTRPKYILESLRVRKIAIGEGIIGEIAQNNQPLLIRDASTQDLSPDFTCDVSTLIAAPVMHDNTCVGVVCAINDRNGGPFSDKQFQQLQEISGQVVLSQNLIAAYRNLSEQQQIARELVERERAEREMRQIFESCGDGMRVLNEQHEMIQVNHQFELMTGFSRDELMGKRCHKYAANPEKCETEDCPMHRAIAGNERVEVDMMQKTVDGSIHCIVTSVPYYDATGRIVGIIQNFKDISDRLKAEKANARDAEHRGKLQMVASVLHDVGNAVTSLGTTLAKSFRDKQWPETQALQVLEQTIEKELSPLGQTLGEEKAHKLFTFTKKLRQAIVERQNMFLETFKRLSNIVAHINDVLSLQRAYATPGGTNASANLVLRELVADAISMLGASLEKRKIKITLDFPSEVIPVKGDKTRLIQVMINLLKNAEESFDSMPLTEGREIVIAIRQEGEQVVLSIKDNAAGFEPKLKKRIFENGFTTKSRGSGIGLYQCRSVIESHGGVIALISEGAGQGAEVRIKLPAAVPEKNFSHNDSK